MGRKYERIGIVEFGRQLFESRDLDPVYIAAVGGVDLGVQRSRWLVAYWLFYDCGFASWASEQIDFWGALLMAAENEEPTPYGGRWPRGSERRHFRGSKSVDAVMSLSQRYGNRPENMIDYLLDGSMDVRSVMKRAKHHFMFGDWIAFKIADMIDAVMGIRVDQSELSVFLYDTPRKSILEHYHTGLLGLARDFSDKVVLELAMSWLWMELKDLRVPHKPESAPDWFSLETVWCKHLSHLHGHYPLWNDIDEINRGVALWGPYAKTAQDFGKAMPKRPQGRRSGYILD